MVPKPTAVERSLYNNTLAAERVQRAFENDAKRNAGTLRSPSVNRKHRKHGRR